MVTQTLRPTKVSVLFQRLEPDLFSVKSLSLFKDDTITQMWLHCVVRCCCIGLSYQALYGFYLTILTDCIVQ